MTYQPSYVIGNSAQLNLLTPAERKHLDKASWVFTLNLFVQHWYEAGFRPTVWVHGDNHDQLCVEQTRECLAIIQTNELLRQRLKFVFLGVEDLASELRDTAAKYLPAYGLHFYRRSHYDVLERPFAKTLDDSIYHCTSTILDLVNLAWILNPGQEIRLLGCHSSTTYQHFYGDTSHQNEHFMRLVWRAFGYVRNKLDIPLIDCNHHHDIPVHGFPCKAIMDP